MTPQERLDNHDLDNQDLDNHGLDNCSGAPHLTTKE